VLYLAEVVQRKSGIMGGNKAELKLLACQRNEQSWTAVSNEEVIPADEASRYSGGALLLVDLTNSKQVQRVQEAGRPLVSILQNFSRLQEKFKTQEEEIEQWKQSLTYQSQELNRREMEMEARREQLEQLEEDFEQMEQKRQEFETTRGEIDGLRTELERRQQELEGAWDHLRGEQRQLEEKQSSMNGNSVLDEQHAAKIQGILQHLNNGAAQPLESCQAQITYATELVSYKQEVLSQHWQSLEQRRSELDQQRSQLDQQRHELQNRWQTWQSDQIQLEQAKAELKVQQSALQAKTEQARLLKQQIQQFEDIQQVVQSANSGEDLGAIASVDMAALESMPIQNLEDLYNSLKAELDKSLIFVQGQEEELDLKQKEIADLESKLSQENEFDRLSLESEVTDEKDAYQFLYETLVGQQRNLREKEGVLRQHKLVLARRQGKPELAREEGVLDVTPILTQVNGLKHQAMEQLQHTEGEIGQIQQTIDQVQGNIDQQAQGLESQRQEIQQQEDMLHGQRVALGEVQGKVQLYEEMLQPLQDSVDNLKNAIGEVSGQMSQLRSSGEAQQSAVGQMHEVLNGLLPQAVA
jgi:chromosome segregation ATPase